MRVFEFTTAIVREPGKSVVNGLKSDPTAVPTYDGVLAEHRAYVDALAEAGLSVDILKPLEDFPDSVFVEDTALVFRDGAILLRPGAPSRLAEREEVRGALARHFAAVTELGVGEYADGGDVLVTPETVFIGLSARTNRLGAEALVKHLAALGRSARVVQTPATVLHFKSACALLSEDTIVAAPALAASGLFAGYRVLETPPGEEGAANLVRVNKRVLVGKSYPRMAEIVAKEGLEVKLLPVSDVAKLDAGLSCMSLRWAKKDEG
ncbi:arginine deiminase family protein [Rhizomicrobium electricum]|uniref:Arginine deiminase family protein n=1 Tax=Rhizomicrobium electricum TaxID=480070 RepID=A0ABN1EZ10_9PROT|nr:arginine deiminase family protein [Rhizomicrobium electricum]NIJ49778.1 dimethylargininase [Rhizomicrobium electricum]